MRYFTVHRVSKGLVDLAEIREDGEVIGIPVSLPPGTKLKAEDGRTWVVLKQVGQALALNRRGTRVGARFSLMAPGT
jgi:hypothetical protein